MQGVKLLGICGSPRKTGNSWYLLECALSAAEDVAPERVQCEHYSIAGKRIAACVACGRCEKIGDCAVEDDFQELRDKWVEADAIVYSVPVYHLGIPGQLKCFIDRLGSTLYSASGGSVSKHLKTIGVAVQGSHMFAGQEQVMTALINHAVAMGCIPVGGDPWQSYLGAAGWTRGGSRKDSLRRLDREGEADAQIAVAAAGSLGRRVVELALLIKSGGMACRDMLARDEGYSAFVSRLGSDNRVD